MVFDVAIIGAGVCGSLIARELSKFFLDGCCLIDRYPEPGCGTSRANSAIVHAGYDAKEGTQKAYFNVLGCEMMEPLCRELHVSYKRIGSMVLSFDEEDDGVLQQLLERGKKNGVAGIELLSREQVIEMEPNISKNVRGALYAKTTGIVSPYELSIAAAENAIDNGVTPMFDTTVHNISKQDDCFIIQTDNGEVKARYVVNCAGVYADRFAGEPGFKIQPRKGEYLLLDKRMGGYVNHVLFQTPTKAGKGILVAPTVHGNLLLGPTSEETDDPEDTETTAAGMQKIISSVLRTVPDIDFSMVITSFAGVRATPNTGDFLVSASAHAPGLINAAGIESPGLTAAPAIAKHVVSLLAKQGLKLAEKPGHKPRKPIRLLQDMAIEERNKLIRENPAYGRIVCRCEGISEGEVVDAIRRNAGARTVDGVKRRVRAGMGRCQGGFCLPSVIEILARELGVSPLEITKSGGSSVLLVEDIRRCAYDD